MISDNIKWFALLVAVWVTADAYSDSKAAEIMMQAVSLGGSVTQAYCVAYQPQRLLDCVTEQTEKAEKLMESDGTPQPTYNPDKYRKT